MILERSYSIIATGYSLRHLGHRVHATDVVVHDPVDAGAPRCLSISVFMESIDRLKPLDTLPLYIVDPSLLL